MVITLAEYYIRRQEYNKAIDTFQVTLKHYPKSIYSIVKTASSFSKLLQKHFPGKHNREQIPKNKRPQFDFYLENLNGFWANADLLGWKEQPKDFETQYLRRIYTNAITQ